MRDWAGSASSFCIEVELDEKRVTLIGYDSGDRWQLSLDDFPLFAHLCGEAAHYLAVVTAKEARP